MARPRKQIDAEEVFKLAQIGCKTTEIADWFGVSVDLIDRRFAEELRKGRTTLRQSLRRWQLQAAQKGNVTMQIWLGKQMLGQSDHAVDGEHEETYKPPRDIDL
jgi:hypothetical protein